MMSVSTFNKSYPSFPIRYITFSGSKIIKSDNDFHHKIKSTSKPDQSKLEMYLNLCV